MWENYKKGRKDRRVTCKKFGHMVVDEKILCENCLLKKIYASESSLEVRRTLWGAACGTENSYWKVLKGKARYPEYWEGSLEDLSRYLQGQEVSKIVKVHDTSGVHFKSLGEWLVDEYFNGA
jgi:hypothetical protein